MKKLVNVTTLTHKEWLEWRIDRRSWIRSPRKKPAPKKKGGRRKVDIDVDKVLTWIGEGYYVGFIPAPGFSVTEYLEDIKADICNDICKYQEKDIDEEKLLQYCGECPINRL